MRTLGIGPVTFEIPEFLDAHDDGDGTLVAYPPKTYANLRFTVSTVAREGKPSTGAGERIVRSIAAKDDRELHAEDGKVWYTYSQPASDGSPGSTIIVWEVGLDAHMIVVSCFIDSVEGDAVMKQRVLDSVLPTIRSFRLDESRAPNQAMELTAHRRMSMLLMTTSRSMYLTLALGSCS